MPKTGLQVTVASSARKHIHLNEHGANAAC